MMKVAEMLTDVAICYGAVKNGSGNGYLPIIVVSGWRKGNTYQSSGYDLDEASALALQMAEEERGRYSGDWRITMSPMDSLSSVVQDEKGEASR
jgi:hypothetical protein